jgi:SAM-dependent methyltransferase
MPSAKAEPQSPSACAWCGAPLEGAESLSGRLRCRSCGVATTDPWPSEAELDAAYEGWYRPPGGRFSGPGDAVLRRSRANLARRLDGIAPPGPILDVGAGEGALVDALHELGRDASGLERPPTRSDFRAGDLEDEEDGVWAGVVFWHSLEHLRRPAEALEKARDLLCAEGVLAIAVPNSSSLQARAFGDRWFALDPPRHLIHLTSAALTGRLRELGLNVERISYVRGGQIFFGWLHGMVGALPGDLDLYAAIRRPSARSRPLGAVRRATTLLAAAVLAPFATLAAVVEVAARRGGTVYVEARWP